ncbi:hypothetical protein NliqN6_1421 [Naganishia liquefaciens]|uniref:DASH complex subunit SPC19 n=1 Tax=Naganishia liquefaciens TaxID=104408 RepID=A0A8H3TQB3_9TREE|nr:hypothetical protein NliqN6_1421 [Naganishia liquefaciens]
MADYLNFLGQCVTATEESVTTIEACITNLQPGVGDLPRLNKVLANEHLYLLLPDPLLQGYKAELADSLKPQINTLVERAEEVIQRDEKKMKSLEERLAIIRSNKTTSPTDPTPPSDPSHQSAFPTTRSAPPSFDMKALNPTQRRKMVMLKGKRERLERELARMG